MFRHSTMKRSCGTMGVLTALVASSKRATSGTSIRCQMNGESPRSARRGKMVAGTSLLRPEQYVAALCAAHLLLSIRQFTRFPPCRLAADRAAVRVGVGVDAVVNERQHRFRRVLGLVVVDPVGLFAVAALVRWQVHP